MTPQVLHVTYTFHGSRADFERDFAPAAYDIARAHGLRWKIWLFDEAQSRGGGTYLFDDETSLRAFADGPVIAALRSHGSFSDITAQIFSVLDGPTEITRGPVPAAVTR